MTNRDTWTTRDYPVLCAVADHLEETRGEQVEAYGLAGRLPDLDLEDIGQSLRTLVGVYVTGRLEGALGNADEVIVSGLTEKGRRAAGLWPAEDSATEALVAAILTAAEQVDDEDERSRLRKVADALTKSSGRVLEGAIAAAMGALASGGL